ncbi:cyanobactin biosynthesis PatC/TenC/TruC family protein [Nostoc sp. 2RC]|jgi:cyanobactin cluster PatC/TenC/TruC protein|uniref:cyanobactin biosynthesis PatC/TenC/TruC family protein n=1 Tax=Nostoc sp. 2RC TaxID=2485484 RepID=UPI0016264B08|nr:cyanobactin biosynthesis PatC/TenC/TruC family protein [Nostoc sp. 2RC]MBC1238199.1 cyanobactin biosynthesis PatC/TenC/TruC family protein [Nostoc sp. 2RC]MBL1201216.1 cyanobactin biosynthesis PatC/TenC/TruC family protein [Nostoc sp. GBBB01]MDZ8014929.1 cyanobactin biosynthesis PatC/TenC/TruC family protein [Nostoc sp. ZfuVER08]
MAKKQQTPENSEPTPKKQPEGIPKQVESHLLATGLEDYGFWWQEMLKAQANSDKERKPFRRGRIWA